MTIDEAISVADTFLKGYITANNFFTPDEGLTDPEDNGALRLFFFRAVPHPVSPQTIVYTFSYGRYFVQDAPEAIELMQKCMDALYIAHTELLKFKAFYQLNHKL